MKNIKGITLISLVITIIVLVILTAITLTFVLGENGLIAKTQQAEKNYEKAEENEIQELAKLDNTVEKHILGTRETVTIDKEEYDNLKNTVDILSKRIKSGTINVPALGAGKATNIQITFDEPLETDQYSVTASIYNGGTHWPYLNHTILSKTVNGFYIRVLNNATGTSGAAAIDWTLVKK